MKRRYSVHLKFSKPGFSPTLGMWVEDDRKYRAALKTVGSQLEDAGVPTRPEPFDGSWGELYVDDGSQDLDRVRWEAERKGPADVDSC